MNTSSHQARLMPLPIGGGSSSEVLFYAPELCAHGVGGLAGCQQCLTVCSAHAISTAGPTIAVDPQLCQGCASCTLSCPTGALTFKSVSRQTLNERLHAVLSAAPAGAVLLVHATTLDPSIQDTLRNRAVVTLQVDTLPAFGDELWLRALGLGATALVLLDEPALPDNARRLIAARVAQVQTVLSALGQSPARLAWLEVTALPDWLEANASNTRTPEPPQTPPLPSLQAWAKFKRLAWIDSVRQVSNPLNSSTRAMPSGSSMGAVRVNEQRCTLCFACANMCPTHALVARDKTTQQLVFQESACVQCGVCVSACPEQAVALQARFAPHTFTSMSFAVLHQEAHVNCTSCGTPFINGKLLASSLKRLKGHPALMPNAHDALLTCPDCRRHALLQM